MSGELGCFDGSDDGVNVFVGIGHFLCNGSGRMGEDGDSLVPHGVNGISPLPVAQALHSRFGSAGAVAGAAE